MNESEDFEIEIPADGHYAGWFKANRESECAGCRCPIYPGEWAKYDQDGQILCNDCGLSDEDPD